MGPMDIPTQRTETNVGSSHLKFWCLKKQHFLLGWLMFGCHDNFSEVFWTKNKWFVFFTLRNQDSKHGNPEQIHIASCCQQNVKEIYDIVSYENKSFCCKSHHYTKGVINNSQNFPNLPQVSPPEALRDRHSSRPNRLANLQYPSDDQILQTIGKQNDPHEMIWNHETSNSTEFETFVILHPGRRKTPLRPDPSPWPTRPSINPWAKIMVKRITFARQRQTAWSIEKNSSSTINGGPAINELARFLLQSARFLFGRFWKVTFPPGRKFHLYAGQGCWATQIVACMVFDWLMQIWLTWYVATHGFSFQNKRHTLWRWFHLCSFHSEMWVWVGIDGPSKQNVCLTYCLYTVYIQVRRTPDIVICHILWHAGPKTHKPCGTGHEGRKQKRKNHTSSGEWKHWTPRWTCAFWSNRYQTHTKDPIFFEETICKPYVCLIYSRILPYMCEDLFLIYLLFSLVQPQKFIATWTKTILVRISTSSLLKHWRKFRRCQLVN